MKSVIEKYYCDCCKKEVEQKDKRYSPLHETNYRMYDRGDNRIMKINMDLCNDCNDKLKKDITSVVSFLSNHWKVTTEVET